MLEPMTRAEHMRWAKARALDYLPNSPREAIVSMLSDMGKHQETAGLVSDMAILFIFEAANATPDSARSFIEGFAE